HTLGGIRQQSLCTTRIMCTPFEPSRLNFVELTMRNAVLLIILSSVVARAQTSPLSPEQRATFPGTQSEATEPFHVVGNTYCAGARNIASYLITTPEGHIMIDKGTKVMHDVIRANVAK